MATGISFGRSFPTTDQPKHADRHRLTFDMTLTMPEEAIELLA